MSEILSGARYTFGGLVVLTLWSIGMVQFVEWKMGYDAGQMAAELAADDIDLLRFGPGPNASDDEVRRHDRLKQAKGL